MAGESHKIYTIQFDHFITNRLTENFKMNKITITLSTFQLHAFTPAGVSIDLTGSLPPQPYFITRQPVFKIISEHLQSVPEILFVNEQTSVMVRTTQRNRNLIRTTLVCVKDDKQGELINMDQSKAFDSSTIGTRLLSCRPAESNPASFGGLASCVSPQVLVKSWFVRVARCGP